MDLAELINLYENLVGIDVLQKQGTTQFRGVIAGIGGTTDAEFVPARFINWAYEDWARESLTVTTLRTYNLPAGQRVIVMDSDFLWLHWLRMLDGSEYIRLYPKDSSEMDRINDQWHTDTGKPLYYVTNAYRWGIFCLYPVPSAAVTIQVSILQSPSVVATPTQLPHLVNPTDVPKMPYEFHTALAYKAAYYALRVTSSPVQMSLALKYFTTYQEAIVKNRHFGEWASAAYDWQLEAGI